MPGVTSSLQRLLPLFDREAAEGRAMVLATVVATEGPTYAKPGVQMLISSEGEYAGLLSGGCLEGDLALRARAQLAGAAPERVRYDMRGPDDLLFGLGSGCEGAMDVLLQRLDAASNWSPVAALAAAARAQRSAAMAMVVRSQDPTLPLGASAVAQLNTDDGIVAACGDARLHRLLAELALRSGGGLRVPAELVPEAVPGTDLLACIHRPAPCVVLLGAGPDAPPLDALAHLLGWQLAVIDHREHFAQSQRFPHATQVSGGGPAALREQLRLTSQPVRAAIVMSHHYPTDLAYLRVLCDSDVPYVGLLGPVARRERLLADLGPQAQRLRSRLHAPIGLNLGAGSPETIALSIAAEIESVFAGHKSPQNG